MVLQFPCMREFKETDLRLNNITKKKILMITETDSISYTIFTWIEIDPLLNLASL